MHDEGHNTQLPKSREELISLATRILDSHDRGIPCDELVAEFQRHVTFPDCGHLFTTDSPPDYIVDFTLGWSAARRKVSKEELISIVDDIVNCRGNESEVDLLLVTFEENCVHPAGSDLIYYPEEAFEGKRDPTVDEIVAKALNG